MVEANVLVVEDDPDVRRGIVRRLVGSGHRVRATADPREVLDLIATGIEALDVVLLDIRLPAMSGIELLRQIQSAKVHASVVMLTGDDSAATATECIRAGAFHYLTKPFRNFELSAVVESGTRHARLRRELDRTHLASECSQTLVGTSKPMRTLREAIAKLGRSEFPILIRGESGTGKELVARALHATSPRGSRAFVAVNCGAIPEALIDSELFGHAKGAFTNATADRAGVFGQADNGTLFLDEIGDMPMAVQARLLRALQEGEIRPVGSTGVQKVNVRVIAATHVDLVRAVESGRFRLDLYHRLNVAAIDVPPLRDRLGDVALLVADVLLKQGADTTLRFAAETLERMSSYDWPGNVRELENVVMHAIALHSGDSIGPSALPMQIVPRAQGTREIEPISDEALPPLFEAKRQMLASFEHRYLSRVLRKANGSVSEAVRLSGVDRANFRRLLVTYGIDPTEFKS